MIWNYHDADEQGADDCEIDPGFTIKKITIDPIQDK